MNTIARLTVLSMVAVFGSYSLLAQSTVQPGQISRSTATALEDGSGRAPIRLSPDGVSASTDLRSIAQLEGKSDRRAGTIWKISIAAMLGATAMDGASSMGKQEGNPLLRSSDGAFGARGVAIKASLTALCIGPQLLLRNHHELRKPFIITNFIGTGLFTFAAVHNQGVSQSSH